MTITLRRARVDDAAAMAASMADPAVFAGLLQMPFANEEMHRSRLAESLKAGNDDLLLVAERGGAFVGSAGLHLGKAVRRRHAALIGISVLPGAQRQGVGTAMLQAMCDYADRWMGLLRLELTVFVDNEAAMALYAKFGFEVEGRHRGYALRDGRFVDAFAMARFHADPPMLGARGEAPAWHDQSGGEADR